MIKHKSLIIFVLIIIYPLITYSQFKFYDRKLDCKLLYRIGFNIENEIIYGKDTIVVDFDKPLNEIKYSKDSAVVFFNNPLNVKIFNIKAKVSHQVSCNVVSGVWDSCYIYFNFIVGHDSDYTIHDNFLKEIYEYSKKEVKGEHEFSSNSAVIDMNIYYDDGDYILYKELREQNQPYFFWYNKRIIYIKALYLEEGKVGGCNTHYFFNKLGFFNSDYKRFEIKNGSKFPPEDFIILYEGGKFNKRRNMDEMFEKHIRKKEKEK